MEFLNPGLLGTQAEFSAASPRRSSATTIGEADRRLRQATGPFLLRRLKTDRSIIADLPEKMEMKVFCHLDQGTSVALPGGGRRD